ncbi:uncharacterized protein UV8b_03470 [Ustilaginoidea virens]|uniref:Uncharacterized protein n=1 Tax=Ustilaginoidea virens TaxID=1159556 RepID=A0A8E5HQF5_USTVR|nr:uncharacterized protein UV8b_03470 [Ustilaginoidea virens]QUC19229.1 hypothetical protein UV8b_03470 [Ustilaginoidea virens]
MGSNRFHHRARTGDLDAAIQAAAVVVWAVPTSRGWLFPILCTGLGGDRDCATCAAIHFQVRSWAKGFKSDADNAGQGSSRHAATA